MKVVWVPPEYGDAVACICSDGTLSLWEEVVEGIQCFPIVFTWHKCAVGFDSPFFFPLICLLLDYHKLIA